MLTTYNTISYKKPFYSVKDELLNYLIYYSRTRKFNISYEELKDYRDAVAIVDEKEQPTAWFSVLYPDAEIDRIYEGLLEVYNMLKSEYCQLDFLKIESVDFCAFGNSNPFRIKVFDSLNDTYDFFYVKKTDASRIYGLELEHLMAPDKMNYLVDHGTMVETHITGVPGDLFMKKHEQQCDAEAISKAFVKFNERCFVRLLGDMRSYNFVVDVKQDFDSVQYKIRPIDFDQQSYEGRKNIYLPQFYLENKAYVDLAMKGMSLTKAKQYMQQEQQVLYTRLSMVKDRFSELVSIMKRDRISCVSHVKSLCKELGNYYSSALFNRCKSMGDIVAFNIQNKIDFSIMS